MAPARSGILLSEAGALELGVSVSRYYPLRTDHRLAGAPGHAQTWSPGLSGGDPQPDWTAEVTARITQLLSSKPPASASAAASEAQRRLNFKTDRASLRPWAIEPQRAPDTRYQATPKPVKRWPARDYGALWQDAATPHAGLPGASDQPVLREILAAATRRHPGARLYPGETLLAHFDFLARVCQAHGLPLAL